MTCALLLLYLNNNVKFEWCTTYDNNWNSVIMNNVFIQLVAKIEIMGRIRRCVWCEWMKGYFSLGQVTQGLQSSPQGSRSCRKATVKIRRNQQIQILPVWLKFVYICCLTKISKSLKIYSPIFYDSLFNFKIFFDTFTFIFSFLLN